MHEHPNVYLALHDLSPFLNRIEERKKISSLDDERFEPISIGGLFTGVEMRAHVRTYTTSYNYLSVRRFSFFTKYIT